MLSLTIANGANAASEVCPEIDVTAVADDPAVRRMICAAASEKAKALAACNIRVPTPLRITATTDLPVDCAGLYDCQTKEILVATPDHLASIARPDRPLRFLSPDLEFASVIAHEMTHAAYDRVPCPFENCLATTEYLAYAMQIQTLPPAARAAVTSNFTYDRDISRDEINPVFLLMAPDKFSQKAWLHLSQRDAPCEFVDQIMRGNIHFDVEHPF
ncbi:hypothetical protein ILP92_09780 [Maribius pontilimi]|uniref:Uncharacterized protein n=1 Tax=Palleronia pontilimi TaxID=1964209 RepID=A0A934IH76_9RHOB|nr:hypothetical protein [Palleronia pontilimi]MBJ3763032.1 hypothetical protein [Palleronia pontilimi]